MRAPGTAPPATLPTSYAQKGVWAVSRLAPASAVLTVPEALHLHGELDVGALRTALTTLVERHEPLRTGYRVIDGTLTAVLADGAAGDLEIVDPEIVDLASAPPAGRDAELARRIDAAVAEPPDVADPPLLRVRLFRLGPDSHVLLVTSHLMVYDSGSRDVFARELGTLYRAAVTGQPAELPPLRLQYPDFAHWQNTLLATGHWDDQVEFWRDRLAGIVDPRLPTDRVRPRVRRFRAGVHRRAVPPAVLATAEALGRARGASGFMVLLAAFQALLAHRTGQADVAVGTPVLYRDRADLRAMIGRFVHYLVIRTEVGPDLTFAALLGRVRSATLGAFARRDLPLEYLEEVLRPGQPTTDDPWFRVVFALHPAHPGALGLPGLTVTRRPVPKPASRYDLELHVWQSGDGGAEAVLLYDEDLFDGTAAGAMLADFLVLLDRVTRDPYRDLAAVFAPVRSEGTGPA